MKIRNGGNYILAVAILIGTLSLTGCPRRALVYEDVTPGVKQRVVEKPAPVVVAPPPPAPPKIDLAQERLLREQAEREAERERLRREMEDRERAFKEQAAKDLALREKLEKERLAKELALREQMEKERLAKELAAKEEAQRQRLRREEMERRDLAMREELERERKLREEEIRAREARIKSLQEQLARAETLVSQVPVGVKEAPIKPTVIEKPKEAVEKQVLANIYFDFDKSEIRPEFREILKHHAEWMRRNPGRVLLIEGHCDERGTHEYNLALGERRAASVFNFLLALGVDKARMRTISYGEEAPADPRSNEDAWERNRRAAFVIDPK